MRPNRALVGDKDPEEDLLDIDDEVLNIVDDNEVCEAVAEFEALISDTSSNK